MYFHATDVSDFLDNVHGTGIDLLKAVALVTKEDLYLSGAKALGLIPKFVKAPLWRLMELPGHILDMNIHFKSLKDFFDSAATDS